MPLPRSWAGTEAELAGSAPFFPIVGLLIGALAGAVALGVSQILPPLPGAVLIVIVLAATSGGLHLDGLSDTADGFFSARPRERVLEIMRDSHVGVMGVIAIVAVLSLKMAALTSVPDPMLWRTVLFMPLAGRCALVITMALLPYARPEGGLAAAFWKRRSIPSAIWAALVLGLVGYLCLHLAGLIAAAVTVTLVLIFAAYCHGKIRGATGDTLGAACEIAEVASVLTAAAWFHLT